MRRCEVPFSSDELFDDSPTGLIRIDGPAIWVFLQFYYSELGYVNTSVSSKSDIWKNLPHSRRGPVQRSVYATDA